MRPGGKNLPMGAKNLPTPRPRTARARPLATLALLLVLAPCGWCDPTTADQAKAVVAAWLARDPIRRSEERLVASGELSPEGLAAMDREVAAEIEDAVAFAEASPFPEPSTATDAVYAE